MLIMIYTSPTWYFRWIGSRPAGDAISNEFNQGKNGNFQCSYVMCNNLFNKYRAGLRFRCFINPNGMTSIT